MKKIGFLILTAAALLAVSCTGSKKADDKSKADTVKTDEKKSEFMDHHNAKNSLDYDGTYEGELPGADSTIKTTIVLGKDNTYIKTTVYSKEPNKPFEEKGNFKWEEDGNTIVLEGITDAPSKYKVGEGTLTQLNMDGKPVEGEMAKLYILKKVSE